MARTKMEAVKASDGKSAKSGKSKKQKLEKSKGSTLVQSEPSGSRATPGTRVKQEIRFYQSNTELLIAKVPFQKLVRDICKSLGPFRFEVQALLALQEAAEMFLTGLFEDASLFCLHGRRVTVMVRDLQLSKKIRNVSDSGACRWTDNKKGEVL
ncbi:unnamed protein product, partial [Effrenium voratum]